MTAPITLMQSLDSNAFYQERDARGGLDHPLSTLASQRIAIIVPPHSSASIGIETALFWAASIIRRMGRAFAEVILVTSDEFRRSASCMAGAGITVEQFLSQELRSADPFGRVEWRTWTDGIDLSDAARRVWLGTLPVGGQSGAILAINAQGWVAIVDEGTAPDLSLRPPDFDAAPAAIAMAACMVSARIFSDAFTPQQRPSHVAFALDIGAVTTDRAVSAQWLSNGGGLTGTSPWKTNAEGVPTIDTLVVVSAGGVGGNFCKILGGSHFHVGTAYVVDPDRFEISNLNRAIGVGISAIGASKAAVAGAAISPCVDNLTPVRASFESWMTTGIAECLRSPGSVAVVGVDQVRTRLMVGSDWPSMLLNGATSGNTFSVGIHLRTQGGCIGCWYGQDDAAYAATRAPMACVAGVAPGTIAFRQVASYPFVSVAAAAQLSAIVVRAAYQGTAWQDAGGTVVSMSLRSPECAQVRHIAISKRCLLLCGEDYVQRVLQRAD